MRFVFPFLILLCCGCIDQPEQQLVMSKFTTWNLPADGSRIPAPRALYADSEDTVYCLDDAGRVLLYSEDGTIQKVWRMPASENGRPEGIVKLQDGRIAVADTHYHRIVFFEPDGTVESMLGTKGRDPGQFVYPVAVTQDPDGFLYVGEYGDRQRVQKFAIDGTFVTEFGEHGTELGQFQRPSGLIWHNHEILVVDAFNNRIQVFSDEGEFLRVLGPPVDVEPFSFPYDLRMNHDGHIYVVENQGARITLINQQGNLLGRYGRPGRSQGQFFNPWGLTVLTDGRILVADTGNHRIVELTP
ncbi:MAG: hypothetical protein ABJZ55_24850 [Fuerstiella sp.]